jgi:hypothetical protein
MICIVRDEFNKSIHISIHYQLSITGIEPQVIAGICGLITTQDLDLKEKKTVYRFFNLLFSFELNLQHKGRVSHGDTILFPPVYQIYYKYLSV